MTENNNTTNEKLLESRVATSANSIVVSQHSGDVRDAVDNKVPDAATPLHVMRSIKQGRAGNARAVVSIIEPLIQLDLNYSAAVDTVNETLMSATLIAEPGGKLERDKRIAADVQSEIIDTTWCRNSIEHFASVQDFGYAVAEAMWQFNGSNWVPVDLIPLPPSWFTFDQDDNRTPLLLPASKGQKPTPLQPDKFVYCELPGYGFPYMRGTGIAAAFIVALANMTTKDWAGFLEQNGQPMRLGIYDPDAIADPAELEKAKKVLRKALEGISRDAWAMLPKGLQIELLESAVKGQTSDLYERMIRFANELVSKRKTGSVLATGTGNTGSGGSQALGSVHQEALIRKVSSLGRRIADALREHLVKPYVLRKFGPNASVPYLRFQWEKQSDIQALSSALNLLVPLGLRVSQEEVRDRLNLRAPSEGEEVLGMPAVQDNPDKQAKTTFTALSASRDALDTLIDETLSSSDYEQADADIDSQIADIINSTEKLTAEELKQALIELVRTGDIDAMKAVLVSPQAASATAGAAGARIDESK